MKKYLLNGLLILFCIGLSGCMQFSLVGGGNKDENSKDGKLYYASFYDFWWGDSPEEVLLKSMRDSEGRVVSRPLYQVMYTSNYLYNFASVVSFGLVVPVDVRWTLVTPEVKEYEGPVRRKKAE